MTRSDTRRPIHRRPTRRTTVAVVAALAAGALLAGCSAGSTAATRDSGPVRGGTLVYATDREPTCLDPHNSGDMPQTYIARQYLDSLVSLQKDGSVQPWLATGWTISDDGTQYDFTLKQGVEFTDGTPFDAQAVVDNFTQILDPATQSSTDLLYLTGYFDKATAISDHVVRITLKRPYSPLLAALSQAFFGMESPKAMARGLAANCESPVGTGPFEVAGWNHERDVELVRNDSYNSAPADAEHQGPAYLDGITWKFLKDNTTRYGALSSGEADVIFNVPPESEGLAKADPSIELQSFVHSGSPFSLDLNTQSTVFSDIRVRQAFVHASDAKEAVESAYNGVFPYEGNAVSSGTPHYDAAYHEPFPYDPAAAKQLLDEAGWTGRDADGYRTKDGVTLTVKLPYNADSAETPPADVTILQDIQAMEKRVGIKVVLQALDSSSMNAVWGNPKAYDLLGNYWNSPTPHVMYIKYSKATYDVDNGQNSAFAYDDELDRLLIAGTATTDPAKQATAYAKAQQILTSKAWSLPLYPIQTRLGIADRVSGVWIEPSEGEPVLSDAYLIDGGK
ncbi:ABC transporter substrate-binding protein [Curtobacterium sp. MCLR17_007]|uniref:ABC transporter substrate-binding protein n=1 Tax=Curtobacterium sp. MCLR17_007 TaxID=2175648 RepID=UPI000DA9D677|nr:ABC transporter substrate-binding protein [Curtobacterium sp. MCLR17_007]WIB60495.1 ABC transporter substrate-binding protein [Curtobacterium sp. MCLR17_007]